MVLSHNNQLTMAYTPRGFAGYSATSPFTSTQFDSLLADMNAAFEYDQLIERLTTAKSLGLTTWIAFLDGIDSYLNIEPFSQVNLNAWMRLPLNSDKYLYGLTTNNVTTYGIAGSQLGRFMQDLAGADSTPKIYALLDAIIQYIGGYGGTNNPLGVGQSYRSKTQSIKVKKMAAAILRKVLTVLFSVPVEQWHAAT